MNFLEILISGTMVFGLGKKKKKAPAPPRPMIRDFDNLISEIKKVKLSSLFSV